MAYQVCKQTVRNTCKVKKLTATAQQTNMLAMENRNVKPRKEFVTDLDRFVRYLHNKGHGVLIICDFNEGLYEKKSRMKKVF